MKVTAMPYGIGPTYTPEYVKSRDAMKVWLDKVLPESRVVFKHDGCSVYAFKKSANDIYFFVYNEDDQGLRIDYIVELHTLAIEANVQLPLDIRVRASYQSSVWRSGWMRLNKREFPTVMFWKYLLSNSRNIVSDAQQSDAGEMFWLDRVNEALAKKLRVFVLDCESKGNQLVVQSATPFLNISDFKKFYTYEEDLSGFYKRFCICY